MANPSRKSISNSISTRDNSACAGVINLGGNLNYMWTNELPSEKEGEGGQMADENVEKRKLILMCRQQVTQSEGGEEEAKKRGGREDIIFAATNCLRKSEPRNFKSGRHTT